MTTHELESAWFQPLNLKRDILVSKFGLFEFNLYRYNAAEACAEEAETRLEATLKNKDGAVERVKVLEGGAKVAKEQIDDLIHKVIETQELVAATDGTLQAARAAGARWGCTSCMQLPRPVA